MIHTKGERDKQAHTETIAIDRREAPPHKLSHKVMPFNLAAAREAPLVYPSTHKRLYVINSQGYY